MIAALFDCDGTLYSAQFGRGLMKYTAEHGRKGTVRAYYAALLAPYLLRKLKLISQETFLRPIIARLAWMIKGWDDQQSRAGFEWVVHKYLLPTQRPEVIARLRDHQAQGHTVVLISAMLLPALELLGKHFSVAGVIGTQVIVQAGRYTGRIIPPVITGHDKGRCTREFFSSHGMDVDWNASYAYADSITDQGLLSLVGHPIAVYPDVKLYAMGQSKNWEIIGSPKS
jgi:HAD superfamily hydrolase (TIGR01490 family)